MSAYGCPHCGEDDYTEEVDVMHECEHIKVLLIYCNNCGAEFLALRMPREFFEEEY